MKAIIKVTKTIELTQEQIAEAVKEKYPTAVICGGNFNTSYRNTSYRNTSYRNTSYRNTSYRNTSYRNTSYRNTSYRNTSYRNTSYRNTSYRNTSYRNAGNYNAGNYNAGNYNTLSPDTIMVFNKPCLRTLWDNAEKQDFLYFALASWVKSDDMSAAEKESNPEHITVGGYLKGLDYKEAFIASCEKASDENIALLKALPNYDSQVFFEISGYDFGGLK